MTETELDWAAYEQITKYIYQTLGRETGVQILGCGKDCKATGISGVEHQIDVLTSHTDGIHTYKTAIECKYWKDNVNKDIIMKVALIIEDAKINKGVIVCKEGYTPDAIAFAKYKNIGLVELREMREEDWQGRLRILNAKSSGQRPEIIKVTIIPSLFNMSQIEKEQMKIDTLKLVTHKGETVPIKKYLTDFKKELHKHPINKVVQKKIFLPMSKLINPHSENVLTIDGFIIWGKLIEIAGPKFYPFDEVWLLMKSIFEEKSYTISKKGIIKEDEKRHR